MKEAKQFIETFYLVLSAIDSFFWSNIAFALVLGLGVYLSFRLRFIQVRSIPFFFKGFFDFLSHPSESLRGIHPLQTFFTSMAGMLGVGNIVGIVVALQIGGPGALFWIWVAAFFGSIIKYTEIFLSLKYRTPNDQGSYDGGSFFFLKSAFRTASIPLLALALFCVYGADVYQFNVLCDCLAFHLPLPKWTSTLSLLILVLVGGMSGMHRVSKLCSLVSPLFLLVYLSMGFWILSTEIDKLPSLLATVVRSAFQGHAPIGGFAGSTCLLALQQGICRISYSSDIGVGYAALVHSESSASDIQKQAGLSIIGVFIDNCICTLSLLIVLLSGLWSTYPPLASSELVQRSLGLYFPHLSLLMPLLLVLAGYTSLISYLNAGMKCASFLHRRWGKLLYLGYCLIVLPLFSLCHESTALLIMSLSGALLLTIHLIGILRLRHQALPPHPLSDLKEEKNS